MSDGSQAKWAGHCLRKREGRDWERLLSTVNRVNKTDQLFILTITRKHKIPGTRIKLLREWKILNTKWVKRIDHRNIHSEAFDQSAKQDFRFRTQSIHCWLLWDVKADSNFSLFLVYHIPCLVSIWEIGYSKKVTMQRFSSCTVLKMPRLQWTKGVTSWAWVV